jgi:hypothetical protein
VGGESAKIMPLLVGLFVILGDCIDAVLASIILMPVTNNLTEMGGINPVLVGGRLWSCRSSSRAVRARDAAVVAFNFRSAPPLALVHRPIRPWRLAFSPAHATLCRAGRPQS